MFPITKLIFFYFSGNTLYCTCDLIWLQAWLRESSQPSPRCSDGARLTEVPLAREICRNKQQRPITTSPGCDTELLTSSANKNNPHISNHLISLMNATTKEKMTNKNSVALSPQESDYFYDEYVDYPFNETLVDSVLNDLKNKDKEKLQLTTNNPNNISGMCLYFYLPLAHFR